MKQELITQLVEELFKSVNELHQEYKDNNISYVIDAQREDNELHINITLNNNKDKEEFEKFIDNLDDDIYEEVIEWFNKNYDESIGKLYNSENYQEVIEAFKSKVREIAQEKINNLQKFL